MREWVKNLDEIDQDCVHQYEYLLGRQLKDRAEYVEIDSKVMEMILEFETREDFFEYYPELKQYANPAALESLKETEEIKDPQGEFIELWGRLGISLDVTPQEFAVLNGEDERVAQDLLVTLIQSERCQMNGNTYFPYSDVLTRPNNPAEDLDFELDPAPLHPVKEQGKAYVIAMADNVGYDVKVLGPFFSEKEAKEELRRLYNGVREDVGEDSIECANIASNSFSVQTYGTDLYYANIKEMALDRAEHSKASEKGYSEVIGTEQPRSLADRISSAKEKSDQSRPDAPATPKKQKDR